MEKYLLILPFFLLFLSCHESDKQRITRLVTEWQGKEILFPDEMVFSQYATDAVEWPVLEADYKVLVFVDSLGCISCKLQLPKWKEWIAQVDSITNGHMPFLFFFQSSDQKEIRHLLKRDDFDYPVCLDREDQLNKLNNFPSDITFQTFLLDKDNRVVSIGNPIHNLAVKDLYLKQITGSVTPSTSNQPIRTTAEAEQTEINLGSFEKNESKNAVFTLRNTGEKPLVIMDTATTCGCASPNFDKHPAQPGETLQVKVIYTPKESGFFNETITVKCNTEKWIKLTILGQVL
ncbi:hypothetical protein M2137_001386 [Parabacteroides sp. PFB2-10]|uniref:DUF1573 domain-containing protein n=1 Tax=Parabacteroides sp. PFB2-10 TaxID=1742405 RepID=UPI0024750FC1|nr:DUF1573 domain-containing protein [Parabacteroides sp. PFB2-10]MDH6312611.1 hypothetical protein [Parabacteroides sp. PFB2-10]